MSLKIFFLSCDGIVPVGGRKTPEKKKFLRKNHKKRVPADIKKRRLCRRFFMLSVRDSVFDGEALLGGKSYPDIKRLYGNLDGKVGNIGIFEDYIAYGLYPARENGRSQKTAPLHR